jgi:hypothetical protein
MESKEVKCKGTKKSSRKKTKQRNKEGSKI